MYTHLVLLDDADFGRFGADPVRVHQELGQSISRTGPQLDVGLRLEPLALRVLEGALEEQVRGPLPPRLSAGAEWIWAVAGELLAGRRLIVVDSAEPFLLLQWGLLSVPVCVRETVDASVGLKVSPARRMQLVLASDEGSQTRRRTAGQDIKLWHANAQVERSESSFEEWFALLRRWWGESRLGDLVHLTSRLCAEAGANALCRIAGICEDIDRVATADADFVEAIIKRCANKDVETDAEAKLIAKLTATAQRRAFELSREVCTEPPSAVA